VAVARPPSSLRRPRPIGIIAEESWNLFRRYYIKTSWRYYRVRFLSSAEACLFDIQKYSGEHSSHHVALVPRDVSALLFAEAVNKSNYDNGREICRRRKLFEKSPCKQGDSQLNRRATETLFAQGTGWFWWMRRANT
jgi:hypothetical protein